MHTDLALWIMGDMLWNAALISAPMLGFTLLVGVVVSLLQAVTQVQEMSLSFVPKLVVSVLVMVAFGPWMLHKLLAYAAGLIANIPSYV
jgi:flagellar biosynthetic protein FliQ